jgi:hypothetical protein
MRRTVDELAAIRSRMPRRRALWRGEHRRLCERVTGERQRQREGELLHHEGDYARPLRFFLTKSGYYRGDVTTRTSTGGSKLASVPEPRSTSPAA